MTTPPNGPKPVSSGEVTPGRSDPNLASGSSFQSHMQNPAQGTPPSAAPNTPSPAQVPQGPALQSAGPSFEALMGQVSTSQNSLNNLQNKLNTKDLTLTRGQTRLLNDKLTDATTHLRAAGSKLGVETPPMEQGKTGSGTGPVSRFLHYLNSGQAQLNSVQAKLQEMKNGGDSLHPADFLIIQAKMAQAQQEIEYSSVLLSKVIDSFKTILNIQL